MSIALPVCTFLLNRNTTSRTRLFLNLKLINYFKFKCRRIFTFRYFVEPEVDVDDDDDNGCVGSKKIFVPFLAQLLGVALSRSLRI